MNRYEKALSSKPCPGSQGFVVPRGLMGAQGAKARGVA